MEINKITFEQFRKLGIDREFEELDVNSDGVINEKDKILAQNQNIQNDILKLLNNSDEEDIVLVDDEDVSLTKAGAAAEETENISKKDYEKSIYKFTYGGLATDGKLRNEVENNKGTTFVLMYCGSVSTGHCGNADWIQACENIKNDKNCILDNMYDLKDYANFKYVASQAVPGLPNGQANSKPTIAKFVDGKLVETIYLDADQANAQSIKEIFMCHLGLTQNNTADNATDTTANAETVAQTTETTSANDEVSSTTDDLSDITSSSMQKSSNAQLNSITIEKEALEAKYKKEQKKLEEKQEEYQKIIDQINNAKDGEDISALKIKAENLEIEIKAIKTTLSSLQAQIVVLDNIYQTKASAVETAENAASSVSDAQVKTVSGISEVQSQTQNDSAAESSSSSDNVDWSKLQVEGKGINVYNLYKLMSNENGSLSARSVKEKYSSYSDEEKAIVDKFYLDDEHKNTKMIGLLGHNFSDVSRWDKDGDGFLSDAEFNELQILAKNNAKPKWDNLIDTTPRGLLPGGQASIASHSTTVNGKKVYFAGSLCVTEDEVSILQDAVNNTKSIPDAMQKLCAKSKTTQEYAECCGDYNITTYTFTNSAGLKSGLVMARIMDNTKAWYQIKNIVELYEKENSAK